MSRYRQTMAEALQKVYEQDDQDHEVSMARGELEAIADKATQLASALQGKSDEGNPLEAWVQSKITKAKDYINSVSDYLMYNPDMAKEETILEKSFTSQQIKQAYGILNDPRYKGGNYDGAVKAIEKLAKGLSNHPDVKNALKRANEENEGRPSPTNPTGKDLEEAMSHTVRFLDPANGKRFAVPFKTHADAEKKMAQLKKDGVKDIKITMDTLKPGIKFAEMVEEVDMNEAEDYGLMGTITPAQLKNIKDIWAKKTKMDITPGVKKMIDRMDIPTKLAIQQAKINVLSDLVNEMYGNKQIDPTTATALRAYLKGRAGGSPFPPVVEGQIKNIFTANKEGESVEKIAKRLSMSVADVKKILGEAADGDSEKDVLKTKLAKEKDTDTLEKQLVAQQGQINMLKQKLENEKNKVVRPEPNPETGEIPLTVGIAHKILRDKREKEMKKEGVEHPAKKVFEALDAVKKKAEKTGMPYSILKQVYDRGMAAWKGGHRPGAGQHQWALARVNSFVTKSSGTWGGADKDLAAKVKGSN